MSSLSSDNIIDFWLKQKKELYLSIVEGKRFQKDVNCARKALTKYDFSTRNQKCKSCIFLSSLFKLEKVPEEFEIMAGKYRGETVSVGLNVVSENFYPVVKKEGDLIYRGVGDENFNLCALYIIIGDLMESKNYPMVNKFITYYECNNLILSLRFKAEFESIKEFNSSPFFAEDRILKKEIVRDILTSLIIFFKFISNYSFCHNEPSIKFLKFDSGLSNFKFKDWEYSLPFNMFVEFSKYSSITRGSERFFNSTHRKYQPNQGVEKLDVDINGTKNYKLIDLDINYVKDYDTKRILFYKIGNRSEDFIYSRRHMGDDSFHHSFDIICFIVSLLLEKSFSHNFFTDYKLLGLWKGLWRKEEYEDITNDVMKNVGRKNDFDEVYSIVKKYYIRVDALEYLYQTFAV